MVQYHHSVIGIFILQIYVSAAPSNITKIEETTIKVESAEKEVPIIITGEINPEEPKLDSQPLLIEESKLDADSTQSFRQKRFYNFYGYGVPPINPIVYPNYNKRDQSAETGVYGLVEDPLEQIHRRLQDIASFVRQPVPPPPPSHFPFFFPVIFIPQYGCDCNFNTANTTPPPQTENPPKSGPQTPKPGSNQTDIEAAERFPQLDDERRNWGLITNESDTEYDENEFARPISFDPIPPSRPLERPAPPVDHGSSQGNSADTPRTTTVRPISPPARFPAPSTQEKTSTTFQERPSSASQGRPFSTPAAGPPAAPYPASFAPTTPRNEQPSTCDTAVLTCCHQVQVTYDCFVVQGCPDPTSYGNPCDSLVILQVIQKFQKFYGVTDGR